MRKIKNEISQKYICLFYHFCSLLSLSLSLYIYIYIYIYANDFEFHVQLSVKWVISSIIIVTIYIYMKYFISIMNKTFVADLYVYILNKSKVSPRGVVANVLEYNIVVCSNSSRVITARIWFGWPVCISKFQRISWLSFSWTDTDLWI